MRQAMIPVVQEVTCGEHGLGKASKDDDPEFGQETQVQYDALELFDYGNERPLSPSLSPSPRSPSLGLFSLQRIVEDDVCGGSNAPVGAMYRSQGRQLGGERSSLLLVVMLLLLVVVVVDVVVVLDVLVFVVL